MSLAIDLMGVGLAQEQATRLGYTAATTIAGVGTAQSGAATIPNMVNNVAGTTSGGQTAFVVDAAVELTMPYLFRNSSSTTALLYPPTGCAFNAGSDNAAVSVAQNQSVLFWRQTATKFLAFSTAEPNILSTANTFTAINTFSAGLDTIQSVANVNDTTPTNAELETAFGGTAASKGRGFLGTVDDADGNTNGFIVWTSDASYYFIKGTKAV